EAYASDLNPVAVLINKAMIEIPPKFAGRLPVNPEARKNPDLFDRGWKGAAGLAEDVRYYGKWMRDEAEKRIGHLYPPIEITREMADDPVNPRPDLQKYVGKKLTVIAWLWARTVKSPNPAFAGVDVPLASTFMLSTKKGKEAYVEPLIEGNGYRFLVKVGKPEDMAAVKGGTTSGKRGGFHCIMSNTPIIYDYIRAEGKAGSMGSRLMAIVAEGERGRVYLAPTAAHKAVVRQVRPEWKPETPLHGKCRVNVSLYGFDIYGDLFTPRQLTALTTFADLVGEARGRIEIDAHAAGLDDDSRGLNDGGTGAKAYAEAVGVYLGLAISKVADRGSSICGWDSSRDSLRNTFGRQAIPMVWDFAEANFLSDLAGSYHNAVDQGMRVLLNYLHVHTYGKSIQEDAAMQNISLKKIISSDPPYYDNIGYADLSDFFYVWLRRSLRSVFPELFATLAVPKDEELVATPYRHGSKAKAEKFFLDGMTEAMQRLADQAHPAFPVTIYYAFKQAEKKGNGGTSSTGWETFLAAVIEAGFAISGTWPMRTELGNRMIGSGTNALASSIIIVCRQRSAGKSSIVTRREFISTLKDELPAAFHHLQAGNIAPVDLAQAAIGPGMAIYTRFSKVIDAEGNTLSVRDALALINQVLDETLAEQEGNFDADTRWALTWYAQHGFAEGAYGIAETLSKAKNTSV
ncbi:MAG: DUF1156 domain-containing protein, partial [Deltaproteobacteria bacterium]|nr:DUF1156 domain-containing protein [Deltaproteobacteria bacterium]